jgi:hypothetical protein
MYLKQQLPREEKRRMQKTVSTKIENLDFVFENSIVRIIANRNFPQIELAGLNVGPFEEGNEYEVHYWIAHTLEKSGVVHFREEELLDSAKLFKIQWRERAQTAGQISKLSDDFYPKLRRYLAELREESIKAPEKMRGYETVMHLTRDIVNSRLRKIVSLASTPSQTEQILKNLAGEERFLYLQLSELIHNWRKQILEYEGTEE